jgi:hypothetical protein
VRVRVSVLATVSVPNAGLNELTVVVLVYVIDVAAVLELRYTAAVEAPTAPSIDKPFGPAATLTPMYTLVCPVRTIPVHDSVGNVAPEG